MAQAGAAARARRAGPHAVALLRGVAREAAGVRARAGVAACSTSARCTGVRYGRVKRLVDVGFGLAGLVALAGGHAGRGRRQPGRPTAARCSTARSGSARAVPASEILKFRTMRAGAAAAPRVDGGGRPPHHPLRSAPAPHPPRRAAPGGQHPRAATCRSSGPARAAALRGRARRASSPSTTCATSCGPASPAGRR